LYTYRFSVKITYSNSDILLEDDDYFSTNKSCVGAVCCCLLLLIARRNAKGRSPHDNPIQRQRGGACSMGMLFLNIRNPALEGSGWSAQRCACSPSPPLPVKDTVPFAQHQYLTIAYVIFHSSYRWQSRDLICTNAIASFPSYA